MFSAQPHVCIAALKNDNQDNVGDQQLATTSLNTPSHGVDRPTVPYTVLLDNLVCRKAKEIHQYLTGHKGTL